MSETRRYDAFVSYQSNDVESARQVASLLSARGWRVFWDREGIKGGDVINNVVMEHLKGTRCVIALWSENAVSSQWVLSEAETARVLGKLVPARIDKVAIPPPFTVIHTHDLSAWSGEPHAQPLLELLEHVETFFDVRPSETAPVDPLSHDKRPSQATSVRRVKVPDRPDQVVVVGDDIWVLSETSGWFVRYRLESGEIERREARRSGPVGLAALGDVTWIVSGGTGTLTALDENLNEVNSIELGAAVGPPMLDEERIWIPEIAGNRVFVIEPESGDVSATTVGRNPISFVADVRGVWAINVGDRTASLVDRRTGVVIKTIGLGRAPRLGLSVGDATWFLDGISGEIVISDTSLDTTSLSIGRSVHEAVVSSKSVWASNHAEGSLTCVDRATLKVTTRDDGFGRPTSMTMLGDLVLVGDAQTGVITSIRESDDTLQQMKVGSQLVDLAPIDGCRFATIDYQRNELAVLEVFVGQDR